MPTFTKVHAEKFATKLNKQPKSDSLPRLRVIENVDGAHAIQQIWCGDKFVGSFGIKHGSKRTTSHGWVARDFGLSPRFAFEFSVCNETIDDMIEALIEKGWIDRPPPAIQSPPTSPTPQSPPTE